MIDTVTGWSEITKYNNKRSISIKNLVETMCLSRYPRLTEITYDQVSEFIVHYFKKYLIETEYGITAKPSTSENTTSSTILERIHQVLGNLLKTCKMTQTYVDKDDPSSGVLEAAAFEIFSTTKGIATIP